VDTVLADDFSGNGVINEPKCNLVPYAQYKLTPLGSAPGIPPYSYMIDTITGANVATNNTGIFDSLPPGEYAYVIIDSLGCKASLPFPVSPSAALDSFGVETTPATCTGVMDGTVTLVPIPRDSADAPFTFTLNDSSQTDTTFSHLTGGTYEIYVTNAVGCRDTLTAVVAQTSTPSVTFNPDTIITANNDTVTLMPIVGGFSESPVYMWTPTAGLSCDTCSTPSATVTVSPTVYYVVVSDSGNPQCSATDSIVLIIKGQYLMPNAFTPNGDGKNDLFGPVTYSYCTILEFHIYNRWGQLVHNSPTYWDGKFDGKDQPSGAYVYYIEVKYLDPDIAGQTDTRKQEGTVVLLR
jgi:gliding motility-associated-like protein